MKKVGMVVVMAVVMAIMAACAKKAVENQTEAETPAQAVIQPEVTDPVVDAAAVGAEQAERERMAGLQRFLNEPVHFDFDSAVLRSDALALLRTKAQWLQETSSSENFIIEGHCDERGTDAYNLALGARRADAVRQYMIDLGIRPEMFQAYSYGEERPFDRNHNEEAWAKNRRAAFVINH
jgi:peptidoglycan-associated lipoprotein